MAAPLRARRTVTFAMPAVPATPLPRASGARLRRLGLAPRPRARGERFIPGAAHWPRFVRNRSEQFEARLSMLRIEPSPSVLFAGMEGSLLPIPVAHGEGRARFDGVRCTAPTGSPA